VIVQPPRAFQVQLLFVFPEDGRSDTELMTYLLDRISPALTLGVYGKGASCARVPLPAGNAAAPLHPPHPS
jgi:hypothetical protein